MNKKLLIGAVSAALVVGAAVAQADVKVGGTADMSYDSIKGCSTTACTENSTNQDVSSNASNITIDASDDLGNGLKGMFHITEFVRLDNNNGGNGALSGGNSYLGLGGDWGSVSAGNHDSGGKVNGRAFDLFGNHIGDSRNADVAPSRVANLIWYATPTISGFSGFVAHSTGTSNSTPTYDNTTSADSLFAQYKEGPIHVGIGYDKLKFNGTTTGSGDKYQNIGGSYMFPTNTTVILFYQKHDNVGGNSDFSVKTSGFGLAQKFEGNNTVKLQYYSAKLEDSSAGGGSGKDKLYAIGVDHGFSKTFTGYVAYAKAKNDSNCTNADGTCMSMAGGGHGDNPGTADGQDMTGFSVGAIYKF